MKTLGQIAYEAYAAAFPWERLSDEVRAAWEAGAYAARTA